MKLSVVLIVLFMSCGVYASKRWPVSKNILTVLEANPTIGKIVRGVGSAALIFTLTCGNMSCGVYPSVGEKLYFVRGGLAYGGVVKQRLDDGMYLVKVNGTNQTTTISKSEIGGEYDPSRDECRLEGSAVVLAGDRDGIKYRNGILKHYYEDGYVEIRITHETMHNDNVVELHEPYTIFVDEDASLHEGGFVIGDFY